MRLSPQLLATLLVACSLQPAASGQSRQELPRRRLELAKCEATPGASPVAWAEFYTTPQRLADGSDLRITDSQGKACPHQILQASGDLLRVAFEPHGPGSYWASWGNSPASSSWKPAGGLLLTTYRFPGGSCKNKEEILSALSRAGKPLGSLFVPSPFLGHNPLGSENQILSTLAGSFQIKEAGRYDVALAADDAAVLDIDGKTVLTKGSHEGLFADARFHQSLDLSAGWHRLSVVHINLAIPTILSICYRAAGQKRYQIIPAEIFAPVFQAAAGPLEKGADFAIETLGESFVSPEYFLPVYQFSARLPAGGPSSTIEWDFGDGQTLTNQREAKHLYLQPGNYQVSMKLTRGSEHLESTYRVEVQERLYRRFPRPTEIPLDQVGELVHAYRRAELSGESLLRGMLLQKAAGRLDGQIAWMRDLAAKGSSVDTTRLQSEALELIETLSEKNRAAEGTDILATLCALPLTDPLRAPLVRRWIVGLCDESDEGGKQAIAKLGSLAWIPVENPFQRVRQMVQFYAQVAAATKALPPAVESAPGKNVYRLGQEAIEEGVMARNVEAYTRAREYRHARELLEQWESLRPLAVTEGFTRTLRVRLEMAQGHMAVACRLARQLVCAYPRNFYAAELLVLATQAAKDLKQTALVEQLQKQLLRDYPESPYARNSAGSPR